MTQVMHSRVVAAQLVQLVGHSWQTPLTEAYPLLQVVHSRVVGAQLTQLMGHGWQTPAAKAYPLLQVEQTTVLPEREQVWQWLLK